jgi:formate dehydrogenase
MRSVLRFFPHEVGAPVTTEKEGAQ